MPSSSTPTVTAADQHCDGPCDERCDGQRDRDRDVPPARAGGTLVPLPVRPAVPVAVSTGSRTARLLTFPRRRALPSRAEEAGMSTAEYAVGMLAACGFAGLLLKVLTSSTVSGLLAGLVTRALGAAG